MLLNDVKDHLVSLIEFALHRRPQPDSTQNFSFATLAQVPQQIAVVQCFTGYWVNSSHYICECFIFGSRRPRWSRRIC
jgi:hypothetical protein